MTDKKTVALIAHDHKKTELAKWVKDNADVLKRHDLVSTATTGQTILDTIELASLTRVKSGPLGGDQQIGALIAEGKISVLVFFTDPMTPHPHDVDVKALTRLATVYDIPSACSRSTADLIIASGFLD